MFLNNDCLEVITEGGKPKHLEDEAYSNSITIQELLDHYYYSRTNVIARIDWSLFDNSNNLLLEELFLSYKLTD